MITIPLWCTDPACKCREFDGRRGDTFADALARRTAAAWRKEPGEQVAPFSASDFSVEGKS